MDIKHNQKPNKVVFLDEEEIKRKLRDMEKDAQFDTSPIAVRDEMSYVREVSFFKRHITYLRTHPKTNPAIYLANLRTMTRIRRP